MKEMKDLVAVDGDVGTTSDTLRPFMYNIPQRHIKVQQLRHFLQAALPFKYWREVRCDRKFDERLMSPPSSPNEGSKAETSPATSIRKNDGTLKV